jgi:hypothetical protein
VDHGPTDLAAHTGWVLTILPNRLWSLEGSIRRANIIRFPVSTEFGLPTDESVCWLTGVEIGDGDCVGAPS